MLTDFLISRSYLDKTKTNISHDFPPELFVRVWYLIQGHSVEAQGLLVILLLHADISHVDFEAPGVGKRFVPHYHLKNKVRGLKERKF